MLLFGLGCVAVFLASFVKEISGLNVTNESLNNMSKSR